MGDLGLFVSGVLASCALVYAAPAALPEKEMLRHTKGAMLTGLSVACSFLLADGVYITADALWETQTAVLLCVIFSFIFSKTAEQVILSERKSLCLPAVCTVLVLTQPYAGSALETVLYAIGTAVGVILLLTALSPVIRRMKVSDAPRPLKGLPSLLLILGLCALAFGGF